MNIEFIKQIIPLYADAALLTVRIGLIGIVLSVFVGIVCAVIRWWKIPILHIIVRIYIELSRNTPLLIDLFFLSKSLCRRADSRMSILHVPFLTVRDTMYGGEKPYRTYSGPRYIGGVSDHCPILLSLQWK